MKSFSVRISRLPIIFFAFFFALISKLPAQGFVIEQYAIDVAISQEGYFDVVETINVNFSEQKRGIIRSIPVREEIGGKAVKVDISNISVDGWKYKTYIQNGYKNIRIGDPDIYLDGRQAYKIRYRVKNAFLFLEDHTEFYWNLIGTEWDVPIYEVAYVVETERAGDILEFAAFSGNRGISEGKITIERFGNRLQGESRERLMPGEGLTVAIKMPVSAVDRTVQSTDGKPFDYFFPIPLALAGLLLGWWRKNGKSRPVEVLDETVTYPPEGVSAAELGVMIDDRANDEDVLSLLPEWGRLGYIRLRDTGESRGKISSDIFIEKTNELPDNAPGYQHTFFNALFRDSDIVLLSSLQDKFYQDFARVKAALRKEVRHSDFYDREAYRIFHSGWFILVGILSVVLGILVIVFAGKVLTGILLAAMIIPAFIIHFSRPKKSTEGMDFLSKLKSFKAFLRESPADDVYRVLDEDPDYFEKMLPYAVAFGLDKAWLGKFQTFKQEVPGWYYYGMYPHNTSRATMSQFTTGFSMDTVQSVFKSTPEPSGTSGGSSFSGGSTGGGFGGGGGSSW